MHRTGTRYSKRPPSTKARQGTGQYPDSLQVGEGGDLRRKILQRTHSIASRSISHSSTSATPGTITKSTPPRLESYYMPAFLSSPRRSPSSFPSSPSKRRFAPPGPLLSSALENHYRNSFYPSPKQVPGSQNPPTKEREDVDITDYYSESICMRGLYATPFSDLSSSPPSSLSSHCTGRREGVDSVKDLDFGLQMLLAREFGTNRVPGIQRGQDRNALNPTFGSAGSQSHVHPGDGDIGEGISIDSDSDRRRGVSFNMGTGEGDAGTNANVDDFDVSSGLSTTWPQRPPKDAIEHFRDFTEEPSPPVYNANATYSSMLTLDPPYEADICDVELTSLTPRAVCESTFMNFTPPHVFNAFLPIRPPPCRIKTVS